ncbi:type II secretion system F family protein [Luteimonas sp. e5]
MTVLPIVVALLVGIAVFLILAASRGIVREVELDDRSYQDPLPAPLRMLWPLVTMATRFVAPRLKTTQLEKTHRLLQASGQDYLLTPEELYGMRIVSAIIAVLMLLFCVLMLGKWSFVTVLFCVLFGTVLGVSYPLIWVRDRRKVRERRVVRELPVYLDFITMAVEAGLNITGAIEKSVEKGPPGPMGDEFSRMLRDLRAGLPRAEALKRMAARMDVPQVTNFTSALIQADKVGANLSDTLRAQATQRREERFLRAEKLALEAPVKMMLPLVMFFFPLIFLFIGYFIYLKMLQEGIL